MDALRTKRALAIILPHTVAHLHKSAPLGTQLLSIGFAIVFCLTLAFVLLLFTNFVVDGLIVVLRTWWPDLCVYKHPGDATTNARVSHAHVKKVALDFIFEQRKLSRRPIPTHGANTLEPVKLDRQVAAPVVLPQFYIATFPQGIQNPARFLCRKHSSREHGLRVAFAAVSPKDRLCFDLASAQRWCGLMPSAFILPAGQAARQHIQTELSLLRMFEFEETTKAVDFVA